MYQNPVAAQDLMKDDLIPFVHGDGSHDLLGISCVEWLPDSVRLEGLALVANLPVRLLLPFNEICEVWNA